MLRAVPLTEDAPPPHPSAPHSGEPRPSRLRRGWLVALVGSLLLHVAMREIWSVWEQRQPAKIEPPKAIEVTLTPPPPPVEPPKPVSPPPAPPPPPKPKPVVKPMVKPVQPIAAEVPKPRPVPPPKPTPPPKPKPLPKPPKPKPPPEPEPAPRELDDLAPPEEFKEPEPEPKPRPIRRRIREPIPEPPREPAVEPEAEPEPPAEVKAPPRPAPPPPVPVKAEPATAAASPEPAARPRSDQDTSRHRPSAETATGGQNSAPVVIARPKPRYPGIAQQRHWEGRVLVRLKVSANGEPSDCEVAESSGHDILDEAARDSVCENWRFKPALRDGKPVDYQATQPVVFKLE